MLEARPSPMLVSPITPTCQKSKSRRGSKIRGRSRKSVTSYDWHPRCAGSSPRSANRQSSAETPGSMPRLEAFGAGLAHGLVRGVREDAGVAVERRAHTMAGSDLADDVLDGFAVGVEPRLARRVEPGQVLRLQVQRLDPPRRVGICDEVRHAVGPTDRIEGLHGDLSAELDARTDDEEGTRAPTHGPGRGRVISPRCRRPSGTCPPAASCRPRL